MCLAVWSRYKYKKSLLKVKKHGHTCKEGRQNLDGGDSGGPSQFYSEQEHTSTAVLLNSQSGTPLCYDADCSEPCASESPCSYQNVNTNNSSLLDDMTNSNIVPNACLLTSQQSLIFVDDISMVSVQIVKTI